MVVSRYRDSCGSTAVRDLVSQFQRLVNSGKFIPVFWLHAVPASGKFVAVVGLHAVHVLSTVASRTVLYQSQNASCVPQNLLFRSLSSWSMRFFRLTSHTRLCAWEDSDKNVWATSRDGKVLARPNALRIQERETSIPANPPWREGTIWWWWRVPAT